MVRDLDWITARSRCPACHKQLAWYDLIPLVSWLLLRGRCRFCRAPISFIYPFSEILCAVLFTALWAFVPHIYFPAYALFFSALIVNAYTDLADMVLFSAMTRGIIPFGLLASFFGLLPISFLDSIFGVILGYGILWLLRITYARYTKKEGVGLGDLDLLAAIGSFVGVAGTWISLALGATFGLCATLVYCIYIKLTCKRHKHACSHNQNTCESNRASSAANKINLRELKIPFGPFLALGAIAYVFFKEKLLALLLGL